MAYNKTDRGEGKHKQINSNLVSIYEDAKSKDLTHRSNNNINNNNNLNVTNYDELDDITVLSKRNTFIEDINTLQREDFNREGDMISPAKAGRRIYNNDVGDDLVNISDKSLENSPNRGYSSRKLVI